MLIKGQISTLLWDKHNIDVGKRHGHLCLSFRSTKVSHHVPALGKLRDEGGGQLYSCDSGDVKGY